MKVQRVDEEGVAVVEISGRLSGGSEAEDLRAMVARLVEEKATRVLIDLSGVPWMNSAGLGVLVSCVTSLRNAGAHVKFLNLNERVRSLLKVTRLLAVFESYFSRDEAFASFRSGERGA